MSEPPTFDAICDDLLADLRAALAPFADQTEDEIMARTDLSPAAAALVINSRRTIARYQAERDRAFGQPHRGHK